MYYNSNGKNKNSKVFNLKVFKEIL